MKIDTNDIQNGNHVGEIVWICHYNQPDLYKKPLRNVPPTRVIVVHNDELPKNKKVYYSATHFRKLGKNDKPTSTIISPVDNTGFRSHSGNPLHVFTTEEECNASWNDQLQDHRESLIEYIKSVNISLEEDLKKLYSLIKE